MEESESVEGTGWRSYRCPVCSHSDGVRLLGEGPVQVLCTHCDTPLEVSGIGRGQAAPARVARPRRPARERA